MITTDRWRYREIAGDIGEKERQIDIPRVDRKHVITSIYTTIIVIGSTESALHTHVISYNDTPIIYICVSLID